MQLGIIGWITEGSFIKAKERGLDFIELDVNDQAEAFLAHVEDVKKFSMQYEMPIAAIGRWGQNKLSQEGEVLEEEVALEFKLIDAASELGCPVYMTGCNLVEGISYYANITGAITYFEKLIAYGKEKNVKIATYNCRWNNFVHSEPAWTLIHGHLPELGIKYDPSHCVYDGSGDYLGEAKRWGHRFYHVHIKGSLKIDGERIDDPPAGLDQTNWGAFIGVLYNKGYKGGLSIEPHSPTWVNELGEQGIDFTVKYISQFIVNRG